MKFRKYLSSFLIASMLLANVTPGYAMTGTHFLDRMPDNSLVIGTTAFDVEDRSSEGFNLNNTINAVKTIENDEANHMYFKVENKWFDLVKGKGEVDKGTIANNVVLFKGVSEPTEYMEVVSKDSDKDNTKTIIEVKKSLASDNYRKYRIYNQDEFVLPTKDDTIERDDWKDIPLDGLISVLNGQIIVVVDADISTMKAVNSGSVIAEVVDNSDEVIEAINNSKEGELHDILVNNYMILGIDIQKYYDSSSRGFFLDDLQANKYSSKQEFIDFYNQIAKEVEEDCKTLEYLIGKMKEIPHTIRVKSSTKNTDEDKIVAAKKLIESIINDDKIEVKVEVDEMMLERYSVELSIGDIGDGSGIEIEIKDKVETDIIPEDVTIGYNEIGSDDKMIPLGIKTEAKIFTDEENLIKSITVELNRSRRLLGKYNMNEDSIKEINKRVSEAEEAMISLNFANEDRTVWESQKPFVPYDGYDPSEYKIEVIFEDGSKIEVDKNINIDYEDFLRFIDLYKNNSYRGIPKILLNGKDVVNLKKGSQFDDPGVKVLDDKDSDFDIEISYEDRDGNKLSKPSEEFVGLIWYVYNTVDSDGNKSNPTRRKVRYIPDLKLTIGDINPRFSNGKIDMSKAATEDNLNPSTENPVILENKYIGNGYGYDYNVLRITYDCEGYDLLDFEVLNSEGKVITRKLNLDPDEFYCLIEENDLEDVEPTYGVEWEYRDESEALEDNYNGYNSDKVNLIMAMDDKIVSPGEYTFRLTLKGLFDEEIVKEKKYTVTEEDLKRANHDYSDDN
jgi:hypothetical protein